MIQFSQQAIFATFAPRGFYGTVASSPFLFIMATGTGNQEFLDHDYPSTLESVDQAEVDVMKAAEAIGFDEDEQHRIGMSFRECMVNAVVHGNRYNRNKVVHVNATRTESQLVIRVSDQGEGFERELVPDPLGDDNLLRHSGRGLFLMDAFMDEVKVQKILPAGTEVTLAKNLA